MNKYNKEEQDFLRLFSKESAVANPIFKSKLKAQMLNELEPKFNIFSFINTAGFSFMAVIVFSFITVISGFYVVSELTKNDTIKSTTVVSDKVKQEVVEKVAEKTSVTALKLLNVDEFLSDSSIVPPTKPVDQSYNLKTTEVTYIPKSQISAVCSNLNLPTELTVTQLYEYFESDRSVTKLTKNNETLALVEFANTEDPVSFPGSFPVSFTPVSFSENPIQNDLLSFSNDLQLIENSSSTTKSFTLTDSVSFDCGNNVLSYPVSFNVAKDNIIREFILNPDYSVKTVNLYLNSISESNKLAEVSISATTKTVTAEQAENLLNNDLP